MYHFRIDIDAAGEWFWTTRAPNGAPVANDAHQGYRTHWGCAKALLRYRKNLLIPDSIKTIDDTWIRMQGA